MDTNIIDIEEHLGTLVRACIDVEAKVILELGVRTGNSTRAFLAVAKTLDAKVISVDIADCSHVANSDRWFFVQMDDLKFEIDGPVDILFIDTSHEYEQTLKELERFSPKVRKGGKILLHDTVSCPGVLLAVNSYLDEHPGEFIFTNHDNCNGLGVLCKLV